MLHIKLKRCETYNSNQATIFPLHTQSLKVKTFISSSESSHIAYQMAFRWRADDGPIVLVLLGSSLPSSIKTLSELDPL